MADAGGPDLLRLQELLRRSKETSAVSQSMLDDPDGAALVAKYHDLLGAALREHNTEVANTAAATLLDLLQKEQALRDTQPASDAAQRAAVQEVIDELERWRK